MGVVGGVEVVDVGLAVVGFEIRAGGATEGGGFEAAVGELDEDEGGLVLGYG